VAGPEGAVPDERQAHCGAGVDHLSSDTSKRGSGTTIACGGCERVRLSRGGCAVLVAQVGISKDPVRLLLTPHLAPRREVAMFTYRFWQLASERAVKTFAQSLLAIFSATGVGLLTVPWMAALSTAGMAAVLSVLTSMASEPVGEPDTPSLLPSASTSPPPAARTSVTGSQQA